MVVEVKPSPHGGGAGVVGAVDAHVGPFVGQRAAFRVENQFLPTDLGRGADPNAPGDLAGEIRAFRDAGIDGYFTDNPGIASS